jgi:hypothetical protein
MDGGKEAAMPNRLKHSWSNVFKQPGQMGDSALSELS